MTKRPYRTLLTRHFSVYDRKTRCCHRERQEWQEKGTKTGPGHDFGRGPKLFVGENPTIIVGKSKFAAL